MKNVIGNYHSPSLPFNLLSLSIFRPSFYLSLSHSLCHEPMKREGQPKPVFVWISSHSIHASYKRLAAHSGSASYQQVNKRETRIKFFWKSLRNFCFFSQQFAFTYFFAVKRNPRFCFVVNNKINITFVGVEDFNLK